MAKIRTANKRARRKEQGSLPFRIRINNPREDRSRQSSAVNLPLPQNLIKSKGRFIVTVFHDAAEGTTTYNLERVRRVSQRINGRNRYIYTDNMATGVTLTTLPLSSVIPEYVSSGNDCFPTPVVDVSTGNLISVGLYPGRISPSKWLEKIQRRNYPATISIAAENDLGGGKVETIVRQYELGSNPHQHDDGRISHRVGIKAQRETFRMTTQGLVAFSAAVAPFSLDGGQKFAGDEIAMRPIDTPNDFNGSDTRALIIPVTPPEGIDDPALMVDRAYLAIRLSVDASGQLVHLRFEGPSYRRTVKEVRPYLSGLGSAEFLARSIRTFSKVTGAPAESCILQMGYKAAGQASGDYVPVHIEPGNNVAGTRRVEGWVFFGKPDDGTLHLLPGTSSTATVRRDDLRWRAVKRGELVVYKGQLRSADGVTIQQPADGMVHPNNVLWSAAGERVGGPRLRILSDKAPVRTKAVPVLDTAVAVPA
jgi:hypothetical protein